MLGDEWTAKSEVMTMFESFTCVMYGQPKEKYISAVRGQLLRHMFGEKEALTMRSKVDLSKLPIAKITLFHVFKESSIALHILSEQTNAAFDTPSQQVRNQE